jgi:uncharacterized protein (DUF1778 family)
MDDEKRDLRLNIRVDAQFLDRLRKAAEHEGISVASFVKRTLTLALRHHASQVEAPTVDGAPGKTRSS